MSSPDWGLLSSYAGLLALACGSIYVGSFGSLPVRVQIMWQITGSYVYLNFIKNPKRVDDHPEDSDDEYFEEPERMTSEDAWLFPVVGSGALLGLYTIVQYFGKQWINWFLGWYFSATGVLSIWKSSVSLAHFLLGSTRWKQFDKTKISIMKGNNSLLTLSWRTPTIFLFPLSVIPSAVYSLSTADRKSVLITDILSLSFSHNALLMLKIDSFQTGTFLLTGLFFYDIWWVFGTEVMVKVATTLDVPIKLLWPKSLDFSSARGFTMLGLGDIVIPGAVIAFALRYDHHRSKAPAQGSFPKPYFYAALIAYFLGLVTTMGVMHFFHKAQPALLYLRYDLPRFRSNSEAHVWCPPCSPACILSFVLTATVRGELMEVWKWSDEPEAKAEASAAAEKKKN
ncbi:hypothetical protein DXG03_006728 [Asterophora parasitica]|uniref:Uncharacterized protein n=1 Tax=Asterophora parasitica TaxID=117018 RepID=A0A9P7KDU1_9AGAR|nr:hypothetical protein DXG03_006728 [Asterophora parasitica]